jgi:hypothetical protein
MGGQGHLELTNEQLIKICEYAERVQAGEKADPKALAFCLQAVALCLHRLQAGEPDPASGEDVDRWYDAAIGQNVRVMWMKVKPVAERLRALGILD